MPDLPVDRVRVARVDRSAYDVLSPDGVARVPALPGVEVTVGDWLAVDEEGRPVAVLPRTGVLRRGHVSGTSTSQLLAANVDVVLVVAGLVGPLPLRRVERLLALAWESGARPVVVLTKADTCTPDHLDDVVRRVVAVAPGVPVVPVSAGPGEGRAPDLGTLPDLATPGTTLALLGASGAGKSTLVNALAGRAVMDTGALRQVDGKGRHTTTHRQLLVLPSGAVVVDTPGLRGVGLHGDAEDGVAQAFTDVAELASACRFADCGHVAEPGCAVLASVAMGDLDPARLEAWRRLLREVAFQARRADARLRAAEKARWKGVHRAQRVRGHRP